MGNCKDVVGGQESVWNWVVWFHSGEEPKKGNLMKCSCDCGLKESLEKVSYETPVEFVPPPTHHFYHVHKLGSSTTSQYTKKSPLYITSM